MGIVILLSSNINVILKHIKRYVVNLIFGVTNVLINL